MGVQRKQPLAWTIKDVLGSPENFSVGKRILHAISLLTCILLIISVIVNCLLGLFPVALVLLVLFTGHAAIYYLSRVLRKDGWALTLLIFLAYTGVPFNYYFNSGIDGPSLFIFYFTFQLIVSVTSKRYHWIFLITTLAEVGLLLYFQYTHKSCIAYTYLQERDRYINTFSAFVCVFLFLYFITRSLLDNYYAEKTKADLKADEALQRSVELENITKEKEKLFSIIIHDLKSPLASIQIYLQTIAKVEIGKEKETYIKTELLRLTKETATNLDNMLIWARDQVENKTPKIVPIEINSLIRSCLEIETPFANSKQVSLYFAPETDMQILADIQMLSLIVRILVNNAIKFSPTQTQVDICICLEQQRCILKVHDCGAGIPTKNQDKLFTLHINATFGTYNEKGNGLGLVLAKQFAERQQIDIWFESKNNEGTTFYLSIPTISEPNQK
ncbi:Signal transduction histidine kinase [bacterium A37T11]|nr:Signal transduction histidine kinase [bacterium A37T11]